MSDANRALLIERTQKRRRDARHRAAAPLPSMADLSVQTSRFPGAGGLRASVPAFAEIPYVPAPTSATLFEGLTNRRAFGARWTSMRSDDVKQITALIEDYYKTAPAAVGLVTSIPLLTDAIVARSGAPDRYMPFSELRSASKLPVQWAKMIRRLRDCPAWRRAFQAVAKTYGLEVEFTELALLTGETTTFHHPFQCQVRPTTPIGLTVATISPYDWTDLLLSEEPP